MLIYQCDICHKVITEPFFTVQANDARGYPARGRWTIYGMCSGEVTRFLKNHSLINETPKRNTTP